MNEILFAYIAIVLAIGLPAAIIVAWMHGEPRLLVTTFLGWAAFVAVMFALFFALAWLGTVMGVFS